MTRPVPEISDQQYQEFIKKNPVVVNGQLLLLSCFSVWDRKSSVVTNYKSCKTTIEAGGETRTYLTEIEGSRLYGIPTSKDQAFYFGLRTLVCYRIQQNGGHMENPMMFRKRDLFYFMGATSSGTIYRQIERWIEIFTRCYITITEVRCRNGATNSYKYRFHIFDAVKSHDVADSPEGYVSIQFSSWYLDTLNAGSRLPIDMVPLDTIDSDVAKILAPILMVSVYAADRNRYLCRSYGELCQVLMIPFQASKSKRERQFNNCRENLIAANILERLTIEGDVVRFLYTQWMMTQREKNKNFKLFLDSIPGSSEVIQTPQGITHESPSPHQTGGVPPELGLDPKRRAKVQPRPIPPKPIFRYSHPHGARAMKHVFQYDMKLYYAHITRVLAEYGITRPEYGPEYSTLYLVQLITDHTVPDHISGKLLVAALDDHIVLDNRSVMVRPEFLGTLLTEMNFNTIDLYLIHQTEVLDAEIGKLSPDALESLRRSTEDKYREILGTDLLESTLGQTVIEGVMRAKAGATKSIRDWLLASNL